MKINTNPVQKYVQYGLRVYSKSAVQTEGVRTPKVHAEGCAVQAEERDHQYVSASACTAHSQSVLCMLCAGR